MRKMLISAVMFICFFGVGSINSLAVELSKKPVPIEYFSINGEDTTHSVAKEIFMKEKEQSDIEFYNKFGLIRKDSVKQVKNLHLNNGRELLADEVENFEALESISGWGSDVSGGVEGLDSLENLKIINFQEIPLYKPIDRLGFLYDLKDLEHLTLKTRSIDANSGIREDRQGLLNLSPLDKLDNLKSIDIFMPGRFASIKLSKKDPSFKLVDPVILSKQFKDAPIKYKIGTNGLANLEPIKGNILEWNNIPEKTFALSFSADATGGEGAFNYLTYHWIIIRWVD